MARCSWNLSGTEHHILPEEAEPPTSAIVNQDLKKLAMKGWVEERREGKLWREKDELGWYK
jgi:hypothetical protein